MTGPCNAAVKVFKVGSGSQEVSGRPLGIAEVGQGKYTQENIHKTDLRSMAHSAIAAPFCSPVSGEELAQHNGML